MELTTFSLKDPEFALGELALDVEKLDVDPEKAGQGEVDDIFIQSETDGPSLAPSLGHPKLEKKVTWRCVLN